MKEKYLILLLIIIVAGGCRQRYDPKVKSLEQSFLVVEANLNPGPDSSRILLTRTLKLTDNVNIKTEPNAQVTVEGEDNTTRSMDFIGNGSYYSTNLNLTIGKKYRLKIRTSDGNEYLSDYVMARVTPPIDSIGMDFTNDGARIYVNASDPSNNTRYYHWDFDETWEINSYYFSSYIYENGSVRPRVLPDEAVFQCWKYNSSKSILLANSARLQNDIIYKYPVIDIPYGDEKLAVRYSMLLKQYALDRDAYNFYDLLKKNTEEVGGLFTPLPSEVGGNIRCLTDPALSVLGYVTASTIRQKRVFFRDIPNWHMLQNCESKSVANNPDSIQFYFGSGLLMPYSYSTMPPAYSGALPNCVDCRVRGGALLKPTYW